MISILPIILPTLSTFHKLFAEKKYYIKMYVKKDNVVVFFDAQALKSL